MAGEQQPLLESDTAEGDGTNHQHHWMASARHQTKRYLTSKWGHYGVLGLVSVDITAIFADLILQLLTCEGRVPVREGEKASEVLGVLSLLFSCLFMVELTASIWAFGWAYFHSRFHCLDASVIVAGFVLDVLLKGTVEQVGSLVVVLRLWRVFKIIEELGAGAEERMEPLQERLEELEMQNRKLEKQVGQLTARMGSHDL